MARLVAFLRAINVGGRRVKMDELAEICSGMGLNDVATYLASGNVVFSSDDAPDALESTFAVELEAALGYDVPTMVRSMDELTALLAETPFGPVRSGKKQYVVFLDREVEDAETLTSLNPQVDRFAVRGANVYWERDVEAGESIPTSDVERALGAVGTRRNLNTVQRIADKFGHA